MKKKVLFSLCLLATAGLQAQVGVNNADPQASLHITPQKTDGTTAEGIIAPNLTRAQLIGKDARYTAAQKGAIVYVTAVDGTATTKTAQITAIGYFYFDGTVWIPFRQPSTIIPTEPWQVQGSATAATGNTQNIYQTGSVAIGTGASAASGYKLDVNGTSNVSGNSRVGSSTVVGAQTVGTTLGVTGATTLASTLNVSGATTVASTGSFTLAGNGAAAGRYLASDVNGKATWTALPAATVTTANNGLAMSGTTTQLGGVLTKATTISGTAANTLTVSAPSIISGPLQISSGTPAAGKFLTSDAAGNATWGTLPATATTEPWQIQGGAVAATTNAQNIYQTGSIGIGASTAVPAAYKLQVTGASYITGNSRVGSSTVVGNEQVSGNLGVTGTTGISGATTLGNTLTVAGATTLNGATTAKATTITGLMKYTNTVPVVGQYLRASAVDGSVGWATLPATATTEPWQVQGGAVAATTNAQNIYQTGSVGIGALTAVPAAYKLQVIGASNVTGNSRVGSSTVVGAQTVGTTLGVTGATTLSSTLSVAGTSALRGATTVGTTTANANLTVYGNTGIGAAPQHKLHVVGNEYVSGTARIGGAADASTLFASAQLELADNNKGFLPNRVALTGATVKAPVAYAVDGMMVYNTATVAAQDLKPGFYYWGANKWNRLVDEIPKTAVNIRNLVANVKSAPTKTPTNAALGSLMDFGTIIIPEDGSYAFTFRLYGTISPVANTNVRAVFYIYLLANNVGKDAAEIDIHPPAVTDMSYSVTLAGEAKAGEVITFRLAHYDATIASIPTWTLKASNVNTNPVRTSMVWWKL